MQFPPFELQASHSTLRELGAGLTGFKIEPLGTAVHAMWLRSGTGKVFLISVDQRSLQHIFEVFTLGIRSLEELRKQLESWQPPSLPADIPENFRRLLTARPSMPTPPTEFDPWPFTSWRTDVLRRAEFIVEDVEVGSTFGDNSNAQSAASPARIPDEASASCEVAAGILFTGDRDHRLLIAVDWMPMNMVVTNDVAQIEEYSAICEAVSLATYLDRQPPRP